MYVNSIGPVNAINMVGEWLPHFSTTFSLLQSLHHFWHYKVSISFNVILYINYFQISLLLMRGLDELWIWMRQQTKLWIIILIYLHKSITVFCIVWWQISSNGTEFPDYNKTGKSIHQWHYHSCHREIKEKNLDPMSKV